MNADGEASENIRDLLSELTEKDADAIRPVLLSLQSMAEGDVPVPSPELAATLEAHGSPKPAAARRVRHRGAIFLIALIGALAAGAGTAAAVSPEIRAGAAHAVADLVHSIPIGPHTVQHSTPPAPPTSHYVPAPPTKAATTARPVPSPDAPSHSNGNGKSSGHANPKSTDHPFPHSTPPAKGHAP